MGCIWADSYGVLIGGQLWGAYRQPVVECMFGRPVKGERGGEYEGKY